MTTILTAQNSLIQFKQGVDLLLEKREYFIKKILPTLVEGRDYFTIKGHKSLGKSGAEKLASIYSLVATFEKDVETMDSFKGVDGLVCYLCTLTRLGEVIGQGRGAAELKNHGNDANKTIKMAQKSGFIDAVIRTAGLSDLFTSDLEDMAQASIQENKVEIPESIPPKNQMQAGDEPMTDKQRTLLHSLIFENVYDPDERERWLQEAESCSKYDASDLISSLMPASRR